MGRDNLSITIPTLFRCPISLDVMTSPVTLSTGVTYNRSSIQRWLDGGNNTCPATMQVLENKDFVPNLTLQRLIQIWSDATTTAIAAAVDRDQARLLIERIKIPNKEFDNGSCSSSSHVTKLINFAVESDENRKFLASVDGFVPLLIRIFGSHSRNFHFAEKVIQLCGIVLMENRDLLQSAKLDKDQLALMLQLLQQQACVDSKIATARVLEILAGDSMTKVFIAEQAGILPELLKQASKESDSNAIEAYISCLTCLSSPKRIRVRIVRLGAVKVITKTLSSESPAVVEKALKLLELVSTCKEGRYEICENGDCLKEIVMKAMKVSRSSTEIAVAILWSLCCLYREERAKEAVMKNNGLGKILVLIQSDCSPAVRQMSSDLLRAFKVNSKACISSYETMTTHIAPF